MALIGLSLVLASVVWVVFKRPLFLQRWLASLSFPGSPKQIDQPPRAGQDHENDSSDGVKSPSPVTITTTSADDEEETTAPPRPTYSSPTQPPTVEEPTQTTPRAPVSQPSPDSNIPSFSLSSSPQASSAMPKISTPPASAAAVARSNALAMPPPAPPTFSAPLVPGLTSSSSPSSSSSSSSLMPPPPPRPPTLKNLGPAATSNNNLAAPNSFARSARQPGTSTLAPPPTHSSKPAKPSRKVMLEPGHSPLDWARLAQSPTSDLRNLPPGTPYYLKVTPSHLKTMTGRRGKDAWTALGGRVYNITPYVAFHPGGGPELLRAAGRDGTRLFGEIHPWVNYEGMLASCMVGMLVDEGEEKKSEMDDMD